MKTMIFAAALAVAGLDTAAAQGRWTAEPADEQIEAAWPSAAKAAGRGGRAIARCRLTTAGEMTGCQVAKETPSGDGFGQAAVDLAKMYRTAPRTADTVIDVAFNWWPPLDRQPDWLKRPSAHDLLGVWPVEAMKQGRGGRATISCMVTVQGLVVDCVVDSERPEGMNFGAAAIALAPQFLMKPGLRNGQPAPSTVRIPVDFADPGRGMAATVRIAPVVQAWPEAPSYGDVVAAYPKKAKDAKRGGRATMTCGVNKSGRLERCDVLAEEPTGHGFGAAARTLVKTFRLGPGPDGKPQDDVAVQLPFAFDPQMLQSPTVGKPSWVSLPPIEDFDAVFMPLKLEATARAQLDCEVVQGGGLTDCKVVSETGPGVGAAALSLAPKFRLSTWTAEGLPTVGGRVRVPLRYDP